MKRIWRDTILLLTVKYHDTGNTEIRQEHLARSKFAKKNRKWSGRLVNFQHTKRMWWLQALHFFTTWN